MDMPMCHDGTTISSSTNNGLNHSSTTSADSTSTVTKSNALCLPTNRRDSCDKEENCLDGWQSKRGESCCAIDIGGTLTKLVYVREDDGTFIESENEGSMTSTQTVSEDVLFGSSVKAHGRTPSLNIALEGGRTLCFEYFHTTAIQDLIHFIKEHELLLRRGSSPISLIPAGSNPRPHPHLVNPSLSTRLLRTCVSYSSSSSLSSGGRICVLPSSSQSLPATKPGSVGVDSVTTGSNPNETCILLKTSDGHAARRGGEEGDYHTDENEQEEIKNEREPQTQEVRKEWQEDGGVRLAVTGGGAYKYADKLSKELCATLERQDEMKSIMRGLCFLLQYTDSVFRFDLKTRLRTPVNLLNDPDDSPYPFLVINIGSGVSILKAEGPDNFVRLTGTCIGGGTVLGLAKLLFGAKSFQEVVTLSESGTNCMDLTVADLLGDAAGSSCLPGDTLASRLCCLDCLLMMLAILYKHRVFDLVHIIHIIAH
eukprot:GHVQ01004627.1.p1 GENE.GHVQ01004627.1~~GHVQ01004627.1.p1  ORF type:complete len:482 (+),score=78.65 GHVQ01004627.1:786-2231(+)